MRWHTVDVRCHHVRLYPVAHHFLRRVAVVDGVEQPEQCFSAVPLSQLGKGPHSPQRGVGVLATVLPDAWHIALDVTGIAWRLVERRGEEQQQLVVTPHEPFSDSIHRLCCARRVGRPRQDSPRLGDGINLAFAVLDRPQGRAVVIVCAEVPVPVPGMRLQRLEEVVGSLSVRGGLFLMAHTLAQRSESGQGGVQEPTQPYAFAAALNAHPVHTVVPVVAADQGQVVRSGGRPFLQGPAAMLVEGVHLGSGFIVSVALHLLFFQGGALEKRHFFGQDRFVTSGGYIVRGDERKP